MGRWQNVHVGWKAFFFIKKDVLEIEKGRTDVVGGYFEAAFLWPIPRGLCVTVRIWHHVKAPGARIFMSSPKVKMATFIFSDHGSEKPEREEVNSLVRLSQKMRRVLCCLKSKSLDFCWNKGTN